MLMGQKSKAKIEREAQAAAEKEAKRVMTNKQIRARARRHQKAADEAIKLLYKPITEWDEEELAQGRPRNTEGKFTGKKPQWINREIHEESVRRFQEIVKGQMNVKTVAGLKVITDILEDNETDDNNRPIVSASVKLDAAKWLVEHVIGKPTQHIEQDISVRLQGILGNALVPSESLPQLPASPYNDIIDAEVLYQDDEGDDERDAG